MHTMQAFVFPSGQSMRKRNTTTAKHRKQQQLCVSVKTKVVIYVLEEKSPQEVSFGKIMSLHSNRALRSESV